MSKKLTTPYPVSLQDGVTFNDTYPSSGPSDRNPHDGGDGEYIEVVKSKPNLRPKLHDTRRHLEASPVPNFSSSFQATRTACRKVPPLPYRRPVPKTPAPLKVDVLFRSSLQRIDALVERTGSPIVLRYRNAILITCILVVTWQLAVLMDHLAQAVRFYCGT